MTSTSNTASTTNDTIICDLSHLGLLEINGADAKSFLQGQVTNDIQLLNGENAQYTGYCNAKGRLLALFLAFSHHDHLHLQVNRSLIEPIVKRLKMYVLRSKVEIKDISDDLIKIGISGQKAISLLTSIFGQIPQSEYELKNFKNGAVLRLSSKTPRFQIFTNKVYASAVLTALKTDAAFVNEDYWNWLDIQNGIPDISLKTQETFVPQMLNLDLLHAINFKKGCYTGQEIVARTHYLGKIKRRTFLATIDSPQSPEAGDILLDIYQKEAGQIVRTAPNLSGGFDVLAEIRLETIETGEVTWQNTVLHIKPLPYDVTSN